METTVCARTQSVAPVQLNIRALSVEGSRGLQCSLNEQCEAEIEVAEPGDGQQDGVSVIGVVGRVLGENPEVFTSVREVDYVAVLECGDQLLWVDVVVTDWESCGPVGRDHFEADDGVQKLRHELAARRLPLSKNIFWRGAVSLTKLPNGLEQTTFHPVEGRVLVSAVELAKAQRGGGKRLVAGEVDVELRVFVLAFELESESAVVVDSRVTGQPSADLDESFEEDAIFVGKSWETWELGWIGEPECVVELFPDVVKPLAPRLGSVLDQGRIEGQRVGMDSSLVRNQVQRDRVDQWILSLIDDFGQRYEVVVLHGDHLGVFPVDHCDNSSAPLLLGVSRFVQLDKQVNGPLVWPGRDGDAR